MKVKKLFKKDGNLRIIFPATGVDGISFNPQITRWAKDSQIPLDDMMKCGHKHDDPVFGSCIGFPCEAFEYD